MTQTSITPKLPPFLAEWTRRGIRPGHRFQALGFIRSGGDRTEYITGEFAGIKRRKDDSEPLVLIRRNSDGKVVAVVAEDIQRHKDPRQCRDNPANRPADTQVFYALTLLRNGGIDTAAEALATTAQDLRNMSPDQVSDLITRLKGDGYL